MFNKSGSSAFKKTERRSRHHDWPDENIANDYLKSDSKYLYGEVSG